MEKVVVELRTCLCHCPKVIWEQRRHQGWFLADLLAHLALLVEVVFCKCKCCLEGVADLASVPAVAIFSMLPVLPSKSSYLFVIDIDFTAKILKTSQVHHPDLVGGVLIQIGIIKTRVDAGYESLVEGADTVCCQEKYARIIFESTQED